MSCPLCDAELSGDTVLDDVDAAETALLGPRGASATTSNSDTTPNGNAITSETRGTIGAERASELPLFAETTDNDIDQLTRIAPRTSNDAKPARTLGEPENAQAKMAPPMPGTTTPRSASEPEEGEFAADEVGTTVMLQGTEVGQVTAQAARKPSVAESAPRVGSSGDRPTRFLRGVDDHAVADRSLSDRRAGCQQRSCDAQSARLTRAEARRAMSRWGAPALFAAAAMRRVPRAVHFAATPMRGRRGD